MAEIYGPFDAGPGANFQESEWSQMFRTIRHDGPVVGLLSDLLVFGDNTGMQVKVGSGGAWVQGHWYRSDAQVTKTIAAAHATLPRWDRVILRLDWSANTIVQAVLTGTPNASPSDPALTQNTSIWEIPLARVIVDAATTSIVAGKVVDQRNIGRVVVGANGGISLSPVTGFKTFIFSDLDQWGKISFTNDNGTFTAGSIYRSATLGLVLAGIIGSVSNLTVFNNAGSAVFDNPNGGTNLRLYGALNFAPSINAQITTEHSMLLDIDNNSDASNQRFVWRKDGGSVELMELVESGFLGLGSTNAIAPWSASFKVIQFGAFGATPVSALFTSSGGVFLAHNFYHDGATYRYAGTGSSDRLLVGSGSLSYDQAVSGSGGSPINWINRISINSTGAGTYTAEGAQFVSSLRNTTATQYTGQIWWDHDQTAYLQAKMWSVSYAGSGILGQSAGTAARTAELAANYPLYIGTTAAQPLTFSTSALKRWQITSAGALEPFSTYSIGSSSSPVGHVYLGPGAGVILTASTSFIQIGTVAWPAIGDIRVGSTGGFTVAQRHFNGTSTVDASALRIGTGFGGSAVTLGDSPGAYTTTILGDNVELECGNGILNWNELNNAFYPSTNGTADLGRSANRWNTVYAAVGTINTSHSSVKRSMHALSPKSLLRLARETRLYAFKYREDKEAYTHIGFKAEDTHRFLSLDGRSSAAASTAAVALGAVAGLANEVYERIAQLENEVKRLRHEVSYQG